MALAIVGEGGPTDRAALPLSTKKRNPIKNVLQLERSPESLRAARNLWEAQRPGIAVRSQSALYNCFGMVFACRRTYVLSSEIDTILSDDDFKHIGRLADVRVGDIIIYRHEAAGEITHAGLVVANEPDVTLDGGWRIMILSQWGQDGEFFHCPEQVPEAYGRHIEYITDRTVY